MRLILTSDLHNDEPKLAEIASHTPAHDAVLVSGDLLDMFSEEFPSRQQDSIHSWRKSILAAEKGLAWCSGNHDFYNADKTPMEFGCPAWMWKQTPENLWIGDGVSEILETPGGTVSITTIPWPVTGNSILLGDYKTHYIDHVKRLTGQGKKLADEHNCLWILLNHEPPINTPLCVGYDEPEANFSRWLLEETQPDFSLHGHLHQAPTSEGGSWIWQVGRTICFNPGQAKKGSPPHHVLLELEASSWKASWNHDYRANKNPVQHATGQLGIGQIP